MRQVGGKLGGKPGAPSIHGWTSPQGVYSIVGATLAAGSPGDFFALYMTTLAYFFQSPAKSSTGWDLRTRIP